MKVIFAGYSKTGTKSMNSALTKLGYNVYDFIDHFWYHEKYWTKIFKDGGSIDDFREMYKDVDAVVDMPSFLFWEEISKAFPDAKIIFATREENSWVESAHRQMDDITKSPSVFSFLIAQMCPTIKNLRSFFRRIMPAVFGHEFTSIWTGIQPNKEILRKQYKNFNAYFLQNAPKHKVLVFDVKDGWEPLCEFLGKEIPETSFPWRNKSSEDEIRSILKDHACGKQLQKELSIITCCVLGFLGVTSYFLSSYFNLKGLFGFL